MINYNLSALSANFVLFVVNRKILLNHKGHKGKSQRAQRIHFFLNKLVIKKPTRNIVIVPNTIVRFVWKGLLNARLLPSVK